MTTMRKTSMILGFLALSATTSPALAEAPDQAKALHRLAGDWKMKGTFTMGGEKSKVTGTISCKLTSGDFGVLCNTTFAGIPGVEKYEETDLFGFDAGDGLAHWFSVTNGGETHDHKGSARGDTWVFQHAGPADGAVMTERIVFKWKGDKLQSFKTVIWMGDDQVGVFEGKLTR
jgi:hypothetical protein